MWKPAPDPFDASTERRDAASAGPGGDAATRTVLRSCSLCEASCGLAFEVAGDRIVDVRPDHNDVWSKGYVCPKGIAMAAVHHDPDRLRTPMRRRADGDFEPISWEEAFALAASRLGDIRARHGADAVAVYVGNPVTHNHGALLMRHGFLKAIGTRNAFSAGSQDTSPRFAASHYLYGNSLVIPVPDVDRTDYFLCVGANPYVSQGSAMATADVKARIRAIRERGGKVVVVDPRRSETARDADELVAIRPGGDAAFLLALVKRIAELRDPARELEGAATGWGDVAARLARLDIGAAERFAGVESGTVDRIAREFLAAARPVAYTRIGVCNNRYGTLATYAGDLVDIVAGRLGAEGGAMFATPAVDGAFLVHYGSMDGHDRWRSRVRGLPETLGDLPAACMAEEMETPGVGQIRALVTYAGNPVLSVPNGRRLERAIEGLEFMVAVDIYLNETTRHADLVLPPSWTLAEDHIDVLGPAMAVHNHARWSPPVVEKNAGELADWEILHELALRLGGGPFGLRPLDALYRLGHRVGWNWNPTSTLDLVLRLGPRGDKFLPWSKGLSLAKIKKAEHGMDLGPLEAGVHHRVFHRDGKVHLGDAIFLDAIDRLIDDVVAAPAEGAGGTGGGGRELLLVGRRDLRTNNSWMHNVPAMVSGRERCVLYVSREDAERAGVRDGADAVLSSRIHSGVVRVRVTDEMRPGVVSLPHGWGHKGAEKWQSVAGAHAGVSANDWTDDSEVEDLVGQSILNGVAVTLAPVEAEAAA